MNCTHERLDEDGICRKCGLDCRRGTPMTTINTPQPTDEIVATDDYIERRMEFISAFPDCGEWHYIRRIRADAATIAEMRKRIVAMESESVQVVYSSNKYSTPGKPDYVLCKLCDHTSPISDGKVIVVHSPDCILSKSNPGKPIRDELAILREQLRLAVDGLNTLGTLLVEGYSEGRVVLKCRVCGQQHKKCPREEWLKMNEEQVVRLLVHPVAAATLSRIAALNPPVGGKEQT